MVIRPSAHFYKLRGTSESHDAYVWEVEELVKLMEPKSILDVLDEVA